MNKMFYKIKQNSLLIIGLGLMLASSGIDGAYLTRIMPSGFFWLGLILNTTADVSGMVLTYYYGLLKRVSPKGSRKYKMANILLGAEVFAVFYSWFFSWRQLLIVMQSVESADYAWIAPIAAAFVPGLLAFIGYTESLLADDETNETGAKVTRKVAEVSRSDAQVSHIETKPEVKPFKHNEVSKTILESYMSNPHATKTEVAQLAKVSRTTVNNYLQQMQVAGLLQVSDNGNGVKVYV